MKRSAAEVLAYLRTRPDGCTSRDAWPTIVKRDGKPMTITDRVLNARGTIRDRMDRQTQRGDGCWLWTGPTSNGYGRVRIGGRQTVQATHVAYVVAHGPIPPGLRVLHHCDTPLCVRPEHLFVGTQSDNLTDAAIKGRIRTKLTASDVRVIRTRLASGELHRHIAEAFGVASSTIGYIKRGEHWRHLT